MTARVFVHVGPHKTGTTFVQQVLDHNRRLLERRGTLFPGHPYKEQREMVLQMVRALRRGDDLADQDRWQGLLSDVAGWTGDDVIVSVENLDGATHEVMKVLVDAFAPAEVHVVYTARDLTQVIPAAWHTLMRNRQTESWESFIERVRESPDTADWPRELKGQDPRRVLEMWREHVPPDRIHVVTVPRSGSDPTVLWRRFCSVVGLDPDGFDLDVPRVNKSLGSAETELLRRLNGRLGRRISRQGYDRWVQVFIARRVLERRRDQTKYGLPPEEHGWVRDLSEQIVDYLRHGEFHLVGDLDELVPPAPSAATVAPDAAGDAEVLDAAVDALAGVLLHIDSGKAAEATEQPLGRWERRARAAVRRVRGVAGGWRSRWQRR
jgi:hypothetical protein